MNTSEPNQNIQNSPVVPTEQKVPTNNINKILATIKEKVPQPAKEAFNKFYANKMFFWPVTIVFSLLFLTIILGLLFGTKTPPEVKTVVKPTPIVSSIPVSTPTGDVLSEIQFKLTELKDQINSLDIRQSPIKPPTINFDIKF